MFGANAFGSNAAGTNPLLDGRAMTPRQPMGPVPGLQGLVSRGMTPPGQGVGLLALLQALLGGGLAGGTQRSVPGMSPGMSPGMMPGMSFGMNRQEPTGAVPMGSGAHHTPMGEHLQRLPVDLSADFGRRIQKTMSARGENRNENSRGGMNREQTY